jgi:hypothetical protein
VINCLLVVAKVEEVKESADDPRDGEAPAAVIGLRLAEQVPDGALGVGWRSDGVVGWDEDGRQGRKGFLLASEGRKVVEVLLLGLLLEGWLLLLYCWLLLELSLLRYRLLEVLLLLLLLLELLLRLWLRLLLLLLDLDLRQGLRLVMELALLDLEPIERLEIQLGVVVAVLLGKVERGRRLELWFVELTEFGSQLLLLLLVLLLGKDPTKPENS